MYIVIIERTARKALDKLSEKDGKRITLAIQSLSLNPRPIGVKKLKGRYAYRIRLGDYRVIYEINDNILTVTVTKVAPRKSAY